MRAGAYDGHVHAGALIPFDALFISACVGFRHGNGTASLADDDEASLVDSEGIKVPARLPLAASIVLCASLEGIKPEVETLGEHVRSNARLRADVADAVLDGRLWTFLSEHAPHTVMSTDPTAMAPRYLDRSFMDSVTKTTPSKLDGDLTREAVDSKFHRIRAALTASDPTLWRAVLDSLRAEAIVYQGLTQAGKPGLRAFLGADKRYRQLRALIPGGRSEATKVGLQQLGRGIKLRGVELRTSEASVTDRVTASTLRRTFIEQHFAAYKNYASSLENPANVSWPICLIRTARHRSAGGPSAGGKTPRFSFAELLDVVRATADLLCAAPDARRLIPGLDVAGDEEGLPSWCAALLYADFDAALNRTQAPADTLMPPSYRVHAGENYHSRLQGLRRVEEAVTRVVPPGRVPRIGHGLVLADTRDDPVERLSRQPIDEALDDLVWAWGRLGTGVPTPQRQALRSQLGPIIDDLGARGYPGIPASLEDHWAAYQARFSTASLRKAGFLVPSTGEQDFELGTTIPGALDGSATSCLLERYLTDPALNQPVGQVSVDPLRLRQLYEALRREVVVELTDRNGIVEACPTSNLVVGGIDGYGRHPMLTLIQEGVKISINTDDPGIFNINLADEYGAVYAAIAAAAGGGLPSPADFSDAAQRCSESQWWSCESASSARTLIAALEEQWEASAPSVTT